MPDPRDLSMGNHRHQTVHGDEFLYPSISDSNHRQNLSQFNNGRMGAIVMESCSAEIHVHHQGIMKGLIIIVVSASSSSPTRHSTGTILLHLGTLYTRQKLNCEDQKKSLFPYSCPVLSRSLSSHYHLSTAASCASP